MKNPPSVSRLDWDSNFFGFGVGQLVGSLNSEILVKRALVNAFNAGFRLVYGQCAHNGLVLRQLSEEMGGVLLDIKRTYAIDLALNGQLEPNIEELTECGPVVKSQMQNLALQAAEFSRFKHDRLLPVDSWKRMYCVWIENCISAEMADKVLVKRDGNRMVGMLTLKFDKDQGQIGLFAVEHAWRGKGIGKALLNAAMQKSFMSGCKKIKVVTQGHNLSACAIYERAGFSLDDEQDVFHFWGQVA